MLSRVPFAWCLVVTSFAIVYTLVSSDADAALSRPDSMPETENESLPLRIFEVPELKKEALQVPQKLKEYRKEMSRYAEAAIGDLNLVTLIREISEIDFRGTKDGFFAGSGEQRMFSIYRKKEKLIVVNFISYEQTPEDVRPYILLHEALGALGYQDEDYQLTSAAFLILNANIHPSFEQIGISYFRSLDRNPIDLNYVDKGGVSSTGGGGDHMALKFKLESLVGAAVKSCNEEAKAQFIHEIIATKIESNWSFDEMGYFSITPERFVVPAIHYLIELEKLKDLKEGSELYYEETMNEFRAGAWDYWLKVCE